MKKKLLIIGTVFFSFVMFGQVCPNAGFELGNFSNWVGGVRQHPSGNCAGPVWTGPLPYAPDVTRHVLITILFLFLTQLLVIH